MLPDPRPVALATGTVVLIRTGEASLQSGGPCKADWPESERPAPISEDDAILRQQAPAGRLNTKRPMCRNEDRANMAPPHRTAEYVPLNSGGNALAAKRLAAIGG